jgi:hypothetical protein
MTKQSQPWTWRRITLFRSRQADSEIASSPSAHRNDTYFVFARNLDRGDEAISAVTWRRITIFRIGSRQVDSEIASSPSAHRNDTYFVFARNLDRDDEAISAVDMAQNCSFCGLVHGRRILRLLLRLRLIAMTPILSLRGTSTEVTKQSQPWTWRRIALLVDGFTAGGF